LGTQLTDKTFVFSGHSTPDHSEPYSPDAVTSGTSRWPSEPGSTPTSTLSATSPPPNS